MSRPRRIYKAVLTVAQTAVSKGINNPYQLYEKTGITYPRAKRLWDGDEKIDLADISALVNHLPCSIKDLIKLQPVASEPVAKASGKLPKKKQIKT